MMRIPLTQGKFALVDDSDYEWLNQWKWCACRQHGSNRWYAMRGARPQILMHQLILNPPKGMESDHINHDGLDNQRSNLRVCTHSQNQHNRSLQQGGASQFKGVYWYKQYKKWQVQLGINGNRIFLGYFKKEIDAAKAYNKAAIKYFGEFARLNDV